MSLTTTVTTKGQVVIPKTIRDQLNIVPSTRILFSLKNNQLTLRPSSSTQEMEGFISSQNIPKLSPQKEKAIIKKAILKKYK